MKKNESIWHRLTAGLDTKAKRTKLWYEIIPSVYALEAITLGRKRKFLGKTQCLILYRDVDKKCIVEWVLLSNLVNRDLSPILRLSPKL